MSDFVLVELDNGQVAPVPAALAKRRNLKVVEGDTVDATGRPVKPTRPNGRPAKPKTSVAKAAEKKSASRPKPRARKRTAAKKAAAQPTSDTETK